MKTCEKMCKECPFHKESIKGYLAGYEPTDFIDFTQMEKAFVCHMMMQDNMTWDEAEEKIKTGEVKMCRGYIESFIKSCNLPKYSELIKECIVEVRESGVSPESMAKWDFVKYHTLE